MTDNNSIGNNLTEAIELSRGGAKTERETFNRIDRVVRAGLSRDDAYRIIYEAVPAR